MRYIFIAPSIMCCSWSVFISCCVFTVFNKVDPIILYFGVRHAPLYCIFILECDTLRCTASCLLWSETRSAVLHHGYFGVRHAPPVLHMNALFLLLLFCECSSLLVLCLALCFSLIFCSELVSLLMSSSLILMFIIY